MHRRAFSVAAAVSLMLVLAAPAFAASFKGSIAINPTTGAWGWSVKKSLAKAEAGALANCQAAGGTCYLILNFHGKFCGAVVYSNKFINGYGPYIGGLGTTKKAALRNAKARASDRHAKLVVTACS